MDSSLLKAPMVIVLSLLLGQAVAPSTASAAPATVTGPTALALAAVVLQHSPLLSAYERRVVARLFDGNSSFGFTPKKKLSITAESIVCRVSDVDIVARTCDLTFKHGKRAVTGRQANEIYAIVAAAGVAPEGTTGSTIESISKLECTIDPNEIKQRAGGGAECSFETKK
jgi:hypothetical protein